MSELSDFADSFIYPAVFDRANILFPEFEFKQHGDKWISGNRRKVDGGEGEKHKVYIYRDRPHYLKDYTRDGKAITTYLQEQKCFSSWIETIQYLAKEVGVSLPEREFTAEAIKKTQERESRLDLLEAINNFFITSLLKDNSDNATEIRRYLEGRGYTNYLPKTYDELHANNKMELGYIPSREELKAHLQGIGFDSNKVDELFGNHQIGDTHKLAIACRENGRIINFAFRTLLKDLKPSYINSNGERFKLFNLKRPSNNNKDIVIVEGIFDALHAQACGIDNVVALGNASLTPDQIKLIKRYGYETITLCLDNDDAGIEGTSRAIENIRKELPDMGVYVASLPDELSPEGKKIKNDADLLIRNEGAEVFQDIIRNAQPWYIYLLDKIFTEIPINSTYKEIDYFYKEIRKLGNQLNNHKDVDLYSIHLLEKGIKLGITTDTWKQSIENFHKEIEENDERSEFSKVTNDARGALDKAQELFDKGQKAEAIELLSNIGKQRNIELLETTFSKLLIPTTEDNIRETLRSKPDNIHSGLKIENEDLTIPSGAITIIAAPTSHGKTSLLINVAINIAKEKNSKPVYLFSYEESKEAVLIKAMNTYIDRELSANNRRSIESYFKSSDTEFIRSHNRNCFIEGKEVFFNEIVNTGKLNILYSDYTSDELIQAIHYLHKKKNIGVVLIDYIQLLRLKSTKLSRQEELKQICLDLKDCAVETGVPIILGAQFNREVTNPELIHPTKIGEAGHIERAANLIIGLWNNQFSPLDEKKTKSNPHTKTSTITAKILKNRDGEAGAQEELSFDGNTGKISNKPMGNSFSEKYSRHSAKQYAEATDGF